MRTIKRAKLGSLEGIGTTKTEAAANLDRQIQWLAAQSGNVAIECRFGLVGVLTPQAEGWSYTIVDSEQVQKAAGQVWASCMFGANSFTDALSTMRNAMCQRAWTVDITDDAAFVAKAKCLPNDASNLTTLFAAYRAPAKVA